MDPIRASTQGRRDALEALQVGKRLSARHEEYALIGPAFATRATHVLRRVDLAPPSGGSLTGSPLTRSICSSRRRVRPLGFSSFTRRRAIANFGPYTKLRRRPL